MTMLTMPNNYLEEALLIDRSDILKLSFPTDDVLEGREDIMKRSRQIHRATSLGNLEHKKVHIIFRDEKEVKRIFTTIWIQVGEYILLKERIKLPVHRILEVIID